MLKVSMARRGPFHTLGGNDLRVLRSYLPMGAAPCAVTQMRKEAVTRWFPSAREEIKGRPKEVITDRTGQDLRII